MITEAPAISLDRETLDRLCAEIEIAWLERQDDTVVDRLAAQHPAYARSLYDFFSLLIAADLDQASVRANNVLSFLEYLTKRTGKKPTTIAAKMNVPYPFLLQVQRYPQNVPPAALNEIATRAARAWGIDLPQTLAVLERPARTAIAASRDEAYSAAPEYQEMINRAKMKKKEQEFWLSFIARGE